LGVLCSFALLATRSSHVEMQHGRQGRGPAPTGRATRAAPSGRAPPAPITPAQLAARHARSSRRRGSHGATDRGGVWPGEGPRVGAVGLRLGVPLARRKGDRAAATYLGLGVLFGLWRVYFPPCLVVLPPHFIVSPLFFTQTVGLVFFQKRPTCSNQKKAVRNGTVP